MIKNYFSVFFIILLLPSLTNCKPDQDINSDRLLRKEESKKQLKAGQKKSVTKIVAVLVMGAIIGIITWLIYLYRLRPSSTPSPILDDHHDQLLPMHDYKDFRHIDLLEMIESLEKGLEEKPNPVIPITNDLQVKELNHRTMDELLDYVRNHFLKNITHLLVHKTANSIALVKDYKQLFIVDIIENEEGKITHLQCIKKEEFGIRRPRAIKLFFYENNELIFTDGASILKLTREENQFTLSTIHSFNLAHDNTILSLVATDQYYYGVYAQLVSGSLPGSDYLYPIFHHVFRVPKESSSEEVIFDADNLRGFARNSTPLMYAILPCTFHSDYFFTISAYYDEQRKISLKDIKKEHDQPLLFSKQGLLFSGFIPRGDMLITCDGAEYCKYQVKPSENGTPEVVLLLKRNIDSRNNERYIWGVESHTFSPDGKLLFVSLFDKGEKVPKVVVYSTEDLEELDLILVGNEQDQPLTGFHAISLQTDPDGQYLFVLSSLYTGSWDIHTQGRNPILYIYRISDLFKEEEVSPITTYLLKNDVAYLYMQEESCPEIVIPPHGKSFSIRKKKYAQLESLLLA